MDEFMEVSSFFAPLLEEESFEKITKKIKEEKKSYSYEYEEYVVDWEILTDNGKQFMIS